MPFTPCARLDISNNGDLEPCGISILLNRKIVKNNRGICMYYIVIYRYILHYVGCASIHHLLHEVRYAVLQTTWRGRMTQVRDTEYQCRCCSQVDGDVDVYPPHRVTGKNLLPVQQRST